MFETIRHDLKRACRVNQSGDFSTAAVFRELWNPGTQAILVHRFGYWADHRSFAPFRVLLRALHFVLQYLFGWRSGIYIPVKAEIGPGLVIHTWGGGVFLPCCPIGRDMTIIGGGVLFDYLTLSIGDDVMIGAGTKSMGRIRIGSRVRTGPNAVVQDDVPDDCIVFGNPGRMIRSASAFKRAGSARQPQRQPQQQPQPVAAAAAGAQRRSVDCMPGALPQTAVAQ